ncbi:hypothetical protein GCM10023350_04160 [Nocardioides endophyticus]|uniref:Uncharacterized protein n=1 Tax=Nocardioides endophyticus TaxID=1353775 RepID=A0ABP8Y9T1_9ACTN
MTPRRRAGQVLLALLLAGGLVGCGSEAGSDGGDEAGWPSGEVSIDTSGLVYAIGDTVHLGDGSTVAVGDEIERFVLGGGGVFYSTDESGPEAGRYLAAAPLYYSDGTGKATRLAESAANPRTSPDGRYLGFVDTISGTRDEFDTPQAQVVVVDLESGEEVARTSEAMGDPGSDDLADLYEDAEPGALVVTDDTATYDGVGALVSIDLASGDVSSTEEADDELFRLPPYDDRRSPDGSWRIDDVDRDYPETHDRLASSDGQKVPLSGVPPIVDLLWWVDDTTAAGIAVDGGFGGDGFYADGTSAELVRCVVPSGACTPVDGTAGTTVHVPEGTVDGTTFELPDGS